MATQNSKETNQKGTCEMQKFLDSSQYTQNGILKYEFIFGDGFISSGGADTTTEIFQMLNVNQKCKILDIGCGIGGGSEYLSNYYKESDVLGIDLSENVIKIAKERYANKQNLKFEVKDAISANFEENYFDLIYSRDVILHMTIQQKQQLFRNIHTWLKPSGTLLITDYCCGDKKKEEWEEEFRKYVKSRGYTLVTVDTYGQMLKDAQLNVKVCKDHTDRWLKYLEEEKNRLENCKKTFLEKFSQNDYDDLHNGWNDKIRRAKSNLQRWGLFIATK